MNCTIAPSDSIKNWSEHLWNPQINTWERKGFLVHVGKLVVFCSQNDTDFH
ncbi:hypothetical protein CsSME_00012339 [Camellia sinensis var. sinensis]